MLIKRWGEFLSKIKSSSLNDNTIVALTGDHSFWIAKGVGQDKEFKRYAVPFFLSIPEKYRPQKFDPKKFGSHEDIFPTLINLTLSGQPYLRLGEDMFSERSTAISSSGLIANESGAFHHDKYWKWKDFENQILEPTEESPDLLKLRRGGQGLIGLTDSFLKDEKKRMPLAGDSDRP
jgi:phosphoglycerol transferase MdoB-like AlkP superfamily enzyme